MIVLIIELINRARYWESSRRKFGRIYQRLFRSVCNMNHLFRSASCYPGLKDSPRSPRRDTMYKFFLAVSLLSVSLSTVALAQQRSGTPEEQAACSRDVQR